MENPWANDWEERTNVIPSWTTTSSPTTTAIRIEETESDIGVTPSWSDTATVHVDLDVKWENDEPSTTFWPQQSSESSKVWQSSYDSPSFAKSSPQEEHPRQPTPHSVVDQVLSSPSPTESPPPRVSSPNIPSPPSPSALPQAQPTPPSSPPLSPGSPDIFGGFESGSRYITNDPDSAAVAPSPAEDGDAWDTPVWDDVKLEVRQEEQVIDEWEAARRRKEELDQHIPPEMLASLLQQFHEFAADLWPEPESLPEEPAWMSEWRNGMEDIEWLTPVADMLLPPPDMTPPTIIPFNKSQTRRKAAEALKLTQNLPLVKSSPLNLYLASRGSLAWEASVKSSQDTVEDASDLLPASWKVADNKGEDENKDKEIEESGIGKGKGIGGLLSFLGRRSTKPTRSPTEENSERQATPSTASAAVTAAVQSAPEVNVSSVPVINKVPSPALPGTNTVPLPSSAEPSPSPNLIATADTLAPQPPPPQLIGAVTPPATQISPVPTPAPAPASAMSRFLGRFSRVRTSSQSPTQRDPFALSSNDLEFLSEVVPGTANDDDHDGNTSWDALSNMIESKPAIARSPPPPPKLAPPPPPPPKLNAPNGDMEFGELVSGSAPQSAPPMFPLQDATAVAFNFDSTTVPATAAAATTNDFMPAFDFDLLVTKPTTQPLLATNMSPPPRPPSKTSARSMSPFRKPSQPSSRSHTPTAIMSSSTASSTGKDKILSHFVLPPPPSSSSTRPVDKVFVQLDSPPPPLPRTQMPASAPFTVERNQHPFSTGMDASPLPPHSAGPSRLRPRPPPPPEPDDEDEFSEFHSTPARSSHATSASPTQTLFPNNSGMKKPIRITTSFDDFDDFMSASSPIRSPTPPRPPAKSPHVGTPPQMKSMAGGTTTPPPPPPVPKTPPHQRQRRKAEHARTKSLVNAAATRHERWPSSQEPSLPQLPPPPSASSPSQQNPVDPFSLDFFGNGNREASYGGMNGTASSPALKSPSVLLLPPPPPAGLGARLGRPSTPTPSPVAVPAKGGGGLSAQDLMFFEGL